MPEAPPGPGLTPLQSLFAVLLIALVLALNIAVLRKAGRSPWWTLLFLVPPAYLAAVWVFAFVRWPRLDAVHVTPPSDYEGGWNVPPRDGDDSRRDDGGRGGDGG